MVMTRTMSFGDMLDKSGPDAGEEALHRGPRGIGEGHGNFPDAATRGSPAIRGGSGFLLQPVPERFHQGRE